MEQENQSPKPQAAEMQNFDRLAGAVESLVKQERWSRRFANFLKLAIAGYIIFFIYIAMEGIGASKELKTMQNGSEHLAVVRLEGPIMAQSEASAEYMLPLLQEAFSDPMAKAVLIKANSPGGSPVQSALINDEITRLKKLYNKPVIAVVEDLCASGCYYITVAADKIIANKGSLIGSIGVRMDSFGFTGLMEKIGVENRSMHAGEHKTFINPFAEKDEAGREFFRTQVLEKTHQQFIQAVRDGRGDRIKETDETYTGLVWLGEDALNNGMIDGLGDMGSVGRELMTGEPNFRYYEVEKSIFEQLLGDISTQTSSRLAMYFTTLH
ncbi:peptidase [Thiosulfatimonas sediminis]|uniref:Peptidase n=1 Tax=Thiosulfatimonas sediminis TaxID=2675054 RepID=A0A6F8PUN9_9GAMM|nr:S49 family peptidase [Thiosulfatimonas sediminis]BBP45862.1 peptidase [Thiosulfatimonas sediminis]